jgi:hypothetical protein
LTVDHNQYVVKVSAERTDADGTVHVRVTLRAQYGTRSVCIVRGFENLDQWSYAWLKPDFVPIDVIAITPGVVCRLIKWAHQAGWNPAEVKSNVELRVSADDVRRLLEPGLTA